MTVLYVVAGVLGGGFMVGRALRIHLVLAIFVTGTATLWYLAHREYQSLVEYCKGSPEVAAGGDKFSCLEPGNWFAHNLALAFLLLIELGLTVMLASGFVHWWKGRRPKGHRVVAGARLHV